jgi:hypothetical protein
VLDKKFHTTIFKVNKKIFAVTMLVAILFQAFCSFIIYANYEINKEKITQQFCENKNKPQIHCNGKCHLMKQLKKAEKEENTPLNNLKEKIEFSPYVIMDDSVFTFLKYSTNIKHSFYYVFNFSLIHPNTIFRPPLSLVC